jgi:hypothetical protein
MSHRPAAIVDEGIIAGEPITAISSLQPIAEWDSGFAVYSQPPNDADQGALLHIDCLREQHHPEAAEHMNTAQRDGLWTADEADPSRGR